MQSFKVHGIVIKRKDFGEADRILTLLTPNKGKIKIIAKGVRKINSRRAPHVELLNHCVLTVHEGKLPILTEAEALRHFELLKNDLNKTSYAFYICELLDGLLAEHQESRAVFDLTQRTLLKLETEEDAKVLISKFKQEILACLGFWPRQQLMIQDSDAFIESIIEKKIKTTRILNLI